MLRQMRRAVRSLTAKVLIALLVASFAIWGIGDIFSFRLDATIARVGDTKVSAQKFADALAREQARLIRETRQPVSYEMMRAAGLDRAILSGLVRDAAFAEELKALGLSVSDEAVAEAIRNNRAFQGPDGKFSAQAYQLLLRQQGISPAEFEELTRAVLAQQILVETVRAVAPPIPGLAARIALFQNEQRSVNMLSLGLDAAPDPGMPDEAALKAFYDAHPELFTEPERRSGEYLVVDAAKLATELAPSEEELRAAYEAERDRFSVPERREVDLLTFPDRAAAEAAIGRLTSGAATFEDIARDLGLAEGETALGAITRDDLPAAAVDPVFGIAGPGIVGPVDLPAGVAIYRVRDISPGGVRPFDEVRAEIAREKVDDAVRRRAPEIVAKVEELRAAGLSLREIAEQTGASWGRFEKLARDGTLPDGSRAAGLIGSEPFLEEVFTALQGEERDPAPLPDGGYLVVMVEEVIPAELKPLDAVRDRAVEAWQRAERLAALARRGEEIAARLGVDASIWDIGEELGVAVLPLAPFTRGAPPEGLPPALVEKIFRAPPAGGAAALDEAAGRVVVAQVASIVAPPPEVVEKAAAEIDAAIVASLRDDLEEYFGRALMDKYEPTIDLAVVDEVFRRLGGAGGQ